MYRYGMVEVTRLISMHRYSYPYRYIPGTVDLYGTIRSESNFPLLGDKKTDCLKTDKETLNSFIYFMHNKFYYDIGFLFVLKLA
jgi:hypothetical protein